MSEAVSERPILFSGGMILEILADRKTQTRRLLKQACDNAGKDIAWAVCPAAESGWIAWFGLPTLGIEAFTKKAYTHGFPCPYGVVGDRLWVRETWRTGNKFDSLSPSEIAARANDAGYRMAWGPVQYMADGFSIGSIEDYENFGPFGRVRQSIFMPRWASRITLEITDVRAQLLQDITEEDAQAEGAPAATAGQSSQGHIKTHRTGFVQLWTSINAKRAPWSSNPWVWRISFRRLV